MIKDKKGAAHASGLTRVPYYGYQATLHKDERVLTPEESKVYNEGKGGNVFNFGGIHINGSGSSEKDAKNVLELIVKQIESAGLAGA